MSRIESFKFDYDKLLIEFKKLESLKKDMDQDASETLKLLEN